MLLAMARAKAAAGVVDAYAFGAANKRLGKRGNELWGVLWELPWSTLHLVMLLEACNHASMSVLASSIAGLPLR